VLQVGRLLNDQDRVLNGFYTGLLIVGGFAVVILGLGSWWLSGRTLNPAQKAWEQQQVFVSNASHELRTPLTLIRASTEYALRSASTPEQSELLTTVLQDCDYMNRLVDDLLLLSRLDTHRLQLEKEPISLPELLSDLAEQFARLAEARQVSLMISQSRGTVWGDQTRLRQVVLILLDNALRHTPPGGSITLSTYPQAKSVDILVADTGRGIPAEHIPHIFERFYQVNQAGGEESRSNGLGLSIAKGLIEAQGGSISLESQEGVGTRVIIRMPAAVKGA
jgi:signal transduction histidine kinase